MENKKESWTVIYPIMAGIMFVILTFQFLLGSW
jgi:hypothetical protein